MKNFDVIIIGGGAIGSFALFNLVRRGIKNCLLIEKASSSGRGATGSWGSLIRAMHLSPVTTKKATRALPFFNSFRDIVGEDCNFNNCGSLYFLKQDQLATVAAQLADLRANNIAFEIFDKIEGKKAFPHFNWFDDDVAIFELQAGTACPYQTTESLIRVAKAHGAQALFDDEVVEIRAQEVGTHRVTTKTGTQFSCEKLVVAAGRWAKSLLAPLGVMIETEERSLQINRFCKNHFEARIPLFIDRNLRAFGHFFSDGSFAGGFLGNEVRPIRTQERLSVGDATMAKMQISKRLNWLKNASLEGGIRAIEAYTSTGDAIIRKERDFDNVIVSTGFSCTGFTLAPLAGEHIADLATSVKFSRHQDSEAQGRQKD